jgi:hypothetical protein
MDLYYYTKSSLFKLKNEVGGLKTPLFHYKIERIVRHSIIFLYNNGSNYKVYKT